MADYWSNFMFNALVRVESINFGLRILVTKTINIPVTYGAKHIFILKRLGLDHECDIHLDKQSLR